jgi:hypothetical protein
MKITKHDAVADGGACVHCGAAQITGGGWGIRTCLGRDDGQGEMRSEPAKRQYAVYDADAISHRIAELRAETDRARFGDAAAAYC